MNDAKFFAVFEKTFGSQPGKPLLKMYRDTLGEKDEESEVVFADPFDVPKQKGRVCDWAEKPMQDTDLRDSESIKWKEDITEYFEREVLPFAPDWFSRGFRSEATTWSSPYTSRRASVSTAPIWPPAPMIRILSCFMREW